MPECEHCRADCRGNSINGVVLCKSCRVKVTESHKEPISTKDERQSGTKDGTLERVLELIEEINTKAMLKVLSNEGSLSSTKVLSPLEASLYLLVRGYLFHFDEIERHVRQAMQDKGLSNAISQSAKEIRYERNGLRKSNRRLSSTVDKLLEENNNLRARLHRTAESYPEDKDENEA